MPSTALRGKRRYPLRTPKGALFQDVMIMVAGGPGKHSVVVPTFGATRAVTVRIE